MKKRIFSGMVSLLLLLALAGCQTIPTQCFLSLAGLAGKCGNRLTVTSLPEPQAVRYVRANGAAAWLEYPHFVRFDSREELMSYYQRYSVFYSFDSRWDRHPVFSDEIKRYTDQWFGEHTLIAAVLLEGSGSITHEVESLRRQEGETCLRVKTMAPEAMTSDMAGWHLLLEWETAARLDGLLLGDEEEASRRILCETYTTEDLERLEEEYFSRFGAELLQEAGLSDLIKDPGSPRITQDFAQRWAGLFDPENEWGMFPEKPLWRLVYLTTDGRTVACYLGENGYCYGMIIE